MWGSKREIQRRRVNLFSKKRLIPIRSIIFLLFEFIIIYERLS